MKKENLGTVFAAAIGMMVLILDGRTALRGASDGINLCLTTLIPSLFPFFLLSILLTSALTGQVIGILRPITALCKLPGGAEPLLAVGLLGGYPVGAQNVATQYRSGNLAADQAERMITICNNAGPAFIFGVLGSMFSSPATAWLLWIIHMASALMVGIILPPAGDHIISQQAAKPLSVSRALGQAVKVTALVCGWVVMMRTALAFLERWFLWLLPTVWQVAIAGILELSNGCVRLLQIKNEGLRFIMAGGMLSLGGICVTLQTVSVVQEISMKLYFPGKILQCCISIVLCCIFELAAPQASDSHIIAPLILAVLIGCCCILIIRYRKKSSSIPAPVGV